MVALLTTPYRILLVCTINAFLSFLQFERISIKKTKKQKQNKTRAKAFRVPCVSLHDFRSKNVKNIYILNALKYKVLFGRLS